MDTELIKKISCYIVIIIALLWSINGLVNINLLDKFLCSMRYNSTFMNVLYLIVLLAALFLLYQKWEENKESINTTFHMPTNFATTVGAKGLIMFKDGDKVYVVNGPKLNSFIKNYNKNLTDLKKNIEKLKTNTSNDLNKLITVFNDENAAFRKMNRGKRIPEATNQDKFFIINFKEFINTELNQRLTDIINTQNMIKTYDYTYVEPTDTNTSGGTITREISQGGTVSRD